MRESTRRITQSWISGMPSTGVWFLLVTTACVCQPAGCSFSLDLNVVEEDAWSYPDCEVGGVVGSCVFSLSCSHSGGRHLGLCNRDFLFSSCCLLRRHLAGQREPPPIEAALAGGDSLDTGEREACGARDPTSAWLSPPKSNRLEPSGKIVGGHEAEAGRWPWQVLLLATHSNGVRRHRCGAVLIRRHWVVTAGHCVDGYAPDELLLVFGVHDRHAHAQAHSHAHAEERRPTRVVVHPDFDDFTYDNDLALLFVGEPVRYSGLVRPVCLPAEQEEESAGEEGERVGYVTGWGATVEGGSKVSVLREVRVTVVSHARCNEFFSLSGSDEALTDVFVCAGAVDEDGASSPGGKDACDGDSGGPLVAREATAAGRWSLVGIVSWGDGCGRPNKVGVYTNVAKFVPWIRSHVDREAGSRQNRRARGGTNGDQ